MTPEQTADLLIQHVAPRDGRTIGKVDVTVWHADVGDLRFEDCCTAVAAHFRESDAWLMPKHVRDQVKKIRERRLHDFQYVPVPGDENTAVYLKNLREQRAAVADGLREPAPAIEPADPERAAQVRKMLGSAFQRPPKADR
jgi:hypothetical protein